MNTLRRLAIPAIVLLATFLCAQPPSSHPHPTQGTTDSNWTQLIGSMEKMHSEIAAVEPSGDGDSDFVRLMLPHHQAALEMAKTQLLYGKDPQLRRLAQEIIADQESEIELMQLWVRQHPASASKPHQMAAHARKEHTQ